MSTDIDPRTLSVRTILNGDERQNYPVADMIFPPQRLVSLLSHDMTLMPGDVIACGTSIGVGSMKQPTNQVPIAIDGIGELANTYVNACGARSEEHTSELPSRILTSYPGIC